MRPEYEYRRGDLVAYGSTDIGVFVRWDESLGDHPPTRVWVLFAGCDGKGGVLRCMWDSIRAMTTT